jgi:hypothetical protein
MLEFLLGIVHFCPNDSLVDLVSVYKGKWLALTLSSLAIVNEDSSLVSSADSPSSARALGFDLLRSLI